jgi:plastocyanin
MRRLPAGIALGALVVALPLAAAGCGTSSAAKSDSNADSGAAATDLTGQKEVTIEVADNSYTPATFKVSPGTKVTYVNKGYNVHNVTPATDGDFTAISLTPGESKSIIAPQNPNTYAFYCTIHGGLTSGQHGSLVVVAPS